MAANLERLAEEFADPKYAEIQASLRAAAQRARELGAPEQFPNKPTVSRPMETSVVTEQLALREKFTVEEREALIADGALVYTGRGETTTAQKKSRDKKRKPSFGYLVNAGDHITAIPSRKGEVAIYPAPDKAFVPDSFGKSVELQDKVVAADALELRKRLGQEGLAEIIPNEASTVTDIIFQHEEATGEWLLGPDYAAEQNLSWVYTRTKNPTNSSGSDVARVGGASPVDGVSVIVWGADDGNDYLGALRMVVPIETR